MPSKQNTTIHPTDQDDFQVHLQLLINAIEMRNPHILSEFEKVVVLLISGEYFCQILAAALHHLAEVDPGTYNWALHYFYVHGHYPCPLGGVSHSSVTHLIRFP